MDDNAGCSEFMCLPQRSSPWFGNPIRPFPKDWNLKALIATVVFVDDWQGCCLPQWALLKVLCCSRCLWRPVLCHTTYCQSPHSEGMFKWICPHTFTRSNGGNTFTYNFGTGINHASVPLSRYLNTADATLFQWTIHYWGNYITLNVDKFHFSEWTRVGQTKRIIQGLYSSTQTAVVVGFRSALYSLSNGWLQ